MDGHSPNMNSPVSLDAFDSDDIPLPLFSRRGPNSVCSPVSPKTESFHSNRDNESSMFGPNVSWEAIDSTNGWSDAFTASAVLSLLRKEPVNPPPDRIIEPDGESREEQLLTCVACCENLEHSLFPESPITSACDHTGIPMMHICTPCLRQSLDLQFSSDPDTLSCPLCHTHLAPEDVQRWASSQTFQAYDTIRTRRILERDTEFVTCVRTDCGSGQLHVGGVEDPVVVCRACGTRTCFIHRDTVYHEGLTCEEYDKLGSIRSDYPGITSTHQRKCSGFLWRICRLRPCRQKASQRAII